jgi:benzodiazapine receptor
METSSIIAIVLFPLLVLIFGSLGAIFTVKKIPTWYKGLNKPKLNPPDWIFGPVWTILYIMIGFSGWVFWERKLNFEQDEIVFWFFYFFQLFLNFIWTPIFFGLNYLFISFLIIALLDISVLINIILFFLKSSLAGGLLIPYMLWVSFATYLNISIWYLNKDKKNEFDLEKKNNNENKEVYFNDKDKDKIDTINNNNNNINQIQNIEIK